MTIDRGFLGRIRSRGEEVLTQISAELMSNPRFVKAMEGALRGREKLEQAAAGALREMNVPTRSDMKRANSRIEALEREVSDLRSSVRHGAGPRKAAGKPKARSTSARSAPARRSAAGSAARRRRTKAGSGSGE